MSSVVISGDTSGAITVTAPAVAGTYTQTLPQITGTLGTLNSGTAVASTSGTSIDFTSIPANVRRITVMLAGVSLSGTSVMKIQLGTDSTTYTTSGYVGGATTVSSSINSTTGFELFPTSIGTDIRQGAVTLTNLSGNTWTCAGSIAYAGGCGVAGGYITLGAALTAVRITSDNGTDTFDAGLINILYE
jgi:hypothetical protein